MNFPTDLKYTATDEWIRVEGDLATLGVSDFAQDQLSDVVFFEATVKVGQRVAAGAQVATLESVKAAADVATPVSGEVVEINQSLPATPELVNSEPYGGAWMVKLKLSDPSELTALLDDAAYQRNTKERGG
ncbi:MAG TPA: glycine cleavage system protein GcvH [Anaerolineales bacterium]